MTPEALHFLPAATLVELLATRRVSSRELLDHFLDRVERLDPNLNAVVALDAERARRAAHEADQEIAQRRSWRPLHGLPVTVKDSLETQGLVTTCGSRELAEHVPGRDADAVALLRAAGAIVFGKTNTPDHGGDIQTRNRVHGVTSNPWDPGRTPGGSSGGSAAALAAGLTGLELGTDTAGSIRGPAHACGVFGLKPTWGVVPSRGHVLFPPGWLSAPDVTAVGPLGRSAGDLDLALAVLAAPTGEAADAWRLQLPGPRHDSVADYRVATWFDDPDAPVGDEVRAVLEDCAGALAASGAVVRPARPPVDLAHMVRLWERFVWSAPGQAPPHDLWEYACHVEACPEGADPETDDRRWARAVALRHRDWVALDEERRRLRAAYADFFRRYDALLAPVMPIPAFAHLDRDVEDAASATLDVDGAALPYWDATRWCAGFGALQLPAASVPAGRTRHGLPVGVQVVGPYLEDRTVIAVARHIERSVGPFVPPPGW